jgi:hypothetical protein
MGSKTYSIRIEVPPDRVFEAARSNLAAADAERLEAEATSRISFTTGKGTSHFEHELTFQPQGNGTMLEYRLSWPFGRAYLGGVIAPFVALWRDYMMRKRLKAFKALVERP